MATVVAYATWLQWDTFTDFQVFVNAALGVVVLPSSASWMAFSRKAFRWLLPSSAAHSSCVTTMVFQPRDLWRRRANSKNPDSRKGCLQWKAPAYHLELASY